MKSKIQKVGVIPYVFKVSENEICGLHINSLATHLIVHSRIGPPFVFNLEQECPELSLSHSFRAIQWRDSSLMMETAGVLFMVKAVANPVEISSLKIPSSLDGGNHVFDPSWTKCFEYSGNSVALLDVEEGTTIWEDQWDDVHNDEEPIQDASFTSNGKYVAIVRRCFLEPLIVYRTDDGSLVEMKKFGLDDGRRIFNVGSTFLITRNWKNLLQLWDVEGRDCVSAISGEGIQSVATTQMGVIGVLMNDGAIRFLNVPSLSIRAEHNWREYSNLASKFSKPTSLASVNGRIWYLGTSTGEVILLKI